MIKRREFLIVGSLLGLSPYISAKESREFEKMFNTVEPTIEMVQRHMFPQGNKIPSAAKMHTTQFLFDTITHKSFDKDIRAFVVEGAQEFIKQEKGRFLVMTEEEKEVALRKYEETNYGSSWLSRIMTLTMEGLFSDPIYGANLKEAGWQALDAFGGQPRPKVRYLDV